MSDKNKITVDGSDYKWCERLQSYMGTGTSCGSYGANLTEDNEWIPTWIHPDCYEAQNGDEIFDKVEDAIRRSHSYFS